MWRSHFDFVDSTTKKNNNSALLLAAAFIFTVDRRPDFSTFQLLVGATTQGHLVSFFPPGGLATTRTPWAVSGSLRLSQGAPSRSVLTGLYDSPETTRLWMRKYAVHSHIFTQSCGLCLIFYFFLSLYVVFFLEFFEKMDSNIKTFRTLVTALCFVRENQLDICQIFVLNH